MSDAFLDTNVILRHLLNDDPVLSARARDIISAVERGTLTVWTSDLVIAELVFVLGGKKTYNQTPQEIADVLLPIIGLPHLKVARKHVVIRALNLCASFKIDYIDAYHAALMKQRQGMEIFSFDTDFDMIDGIVRRDRLD